MGTSTGYLERAWADLTCDNDWWRSALLLGIANCAPIIGQITTSGYLYDWAKEAAWGLHRPLPYRVGNLRRRLTYGSFWLVITLIWVVPLLIAAGLLLLVPAAGRGLSFLFVLLAFVSSLFSSVGVMRAVIYEEAMTGLQFIRVFKMAARDPFGLVRVFAISMLNYLVWFAAIIIVFIPTMPLMSMIASANSEMLTGLGVFPLVGLWFVTVVLSLFCWFIACAISTLTNALFVRALGIWVAQFHPERWGGPKDPLPEKDDAADDEKTSDNEAAETNPDSPDPETDTQPEAESDSEEPDVEDAPSEAPADETTSDEPPEDDHVEASPSSPDAAAQNSAIDVPSDEANPDEPSEAEEGTE